MFCCSAEVTQKYQKQCLQTCKINLYLCLRDGVLFLLPFNIEIYNMVNRLYSGENEFSAEHFSNTVSAKQTP